MGAISVTVVLALFILLFPESRKPSILLVYTSSSHTILSALVILSCINGISLLWQPSHPSMHFANGCSDAGSDQFDRIKLSIPLVGPMFRMVAISRLQNLIDTNESGSMTSTLETAKGVVGNKVLAESSSLHRKAS